jgi:hypothetical protein
MPFSMVATIIMLHAEMSLGVLIFNNTVCALEVEKNIGGKYHQFVVLLMQNFICISSSGIMSQFVYYCIICMIVFAIKMWFTKMNLQVSDFDIIVHA